MQGFALKAVTSSKGYADMACNPGLHAQQGHMSRQTGSQAAWTGDQRQNRSAPAEHARQRDLGLIKRQTLPHADPHALRMHTSQLCFIETVKEHTR
jgi:hypothetical protein